MQEVFTGPAIHTWGCYIIIPTPSTITAGGSQKMIPSPVCSRQPLRQPWTHEHLFWERAIALGQAIDNSTWKNYGSALNSYLNFVKIHDFPLEPTTETLSLFTVYMSHHIKPNSVATYLSGICQQLEPYFPNVRSARNSALVHRTLQGCKQLHAIPMSCKCALTLGDLKTVINGLSNSNDYNNLLFLAQLLTGFFTLFCLGEMMHPNDPKLCDPRKADRFFEGNIIVVRKNQHALDPHKYFTAYLCVCDKKFPLSSPLWLTSKGAIPTRSFFIKHLQCFFNSDTAGQSKESRIWNFRTSGVRRMGLSAIGKFRS